jgi:ribonuclease HII
MKTLTKPSFKEEQLLWNSNIDYVIGIDEVGRGAFAGPIVAAGVVFAQDVDVKLLNDVNDSKLIKPLLRKKLSEVIKENSLYWTVQQVDINYINKYGIGKANSAVFRKVIKDLFLQFESSKKYHILIDGFHRKYLPGGLNHQKGIVKGDTKSYSIAAASILAKVYRDDLMKKQHKTYPAYGFTRNKGYGTKEHQNAILSNGLCDLHRTSFVDFLLS